MIYLFYALCLIVGVLCGITIGKNQKPKCNHEWELVEDFKINNVYRDGSKHQVGMMKVYECKHCKELKQIRTEL